MKTVIYYIVLTCFIYSLISLPILNGTWQEYLLIISSLSTTVLALKDQVDFDKAKFFRILAFITVYLAVYCIIFYMYSDWSSLETISLIILCISPIVTFIKLLLKMKKENGIFPQEPAD